MRAAAGGGRRGWVLLTRGVRRVARGILVAVTLRHCFLVISICTLRLFRGWTLVFALPPFGGSVRVHGPALFVTANTLRWLATGS